MKTKTRAAPARPEIPPPRARKAAPLEAGRAAVPTETPTAQASAVLPSKATEGLVLATAPVPMSTTTLVHPRPQAKSTGASKTTTSSAINQPTTQPTN